MDLFHLISFLCHVRNLLAFTSIFMYYTIRSFDCGIYKDFVSFLVGYPVFSYQLVSCIFSLFSYLIFSYLIFVLKDSNIYLSTSNIFFISQLIYFVHSCFSSVYATVQYPPCYNHDTSR